MHPQRTVLILDLSKLIHRYEQDPTVALQLPWIDVQMLIAIAMSQPMLPNAEEASVDLVEFIIMSSGYPYPIEMEYFEKIEEVLSLMARDVDDLIRYYGQTKPIDMFNVVFLKWLDRHSIALACYHGNNSDTHKNFAESRQAAIDYISQTTGLDFRDFSSRLR